MIAVKNFIEILKKYRSVISYLFFGVCTTVINIVSYYLCYNIVAIPNVVSTIIAWVVAVVFAFVTNKLYVFNSSSFKGNILIMEIISFFGCRLLTGILDVAIMYVAVDVFGWDSTLWKLISNVLVIILNYIASKLIIFKKR